MVRTIVQAPEGQAELSDKAKRLLAAHDREIRTHQNRQKD